VYTESLLKERVEFRTIEIHFRVITDET